MKTTQISGLLLALCLTACFSCTNSNSKPGKSKSDTLSVSIPEFNADTAFSIVKKQVEFGPRVPNSKSQELCAAYLSSTLKQYSNAVMVQEFKVTAYNGKQLQAKNIIASFEPEKKTRILLCSHWDSRPFADQDPDAKNHHTAIDGANDGASGVGVLLEIARILKLHQAPVGVDIVLFDVEDYGEPQFVETKKEDSWCLGSQYWAKNPHKAGYTANFGILLDMVGAENAVFTQDGISRHFAQDILNKVWHAAEKAGYGSYFSTQSTASLTDDHYYINELIKIPTIDIIHHDASTVSGFYKTWHTLNDNISTINRNTLKAVGQTLLTVIYEEGIVL